VALSEVRLRELVLTLTEERLEREVTAAPGCSLGVAWAVGREEREEREESEASGWRSEIEGGGGGSSAERARKGKRKMWKPPIPKRETARNKDEGGTGFSPG